MIYDRRSRTNYERACPSTPGRRRNNTVSLALFAAVRESSESRRVRVQPREIRYDFSALADRAVITKVFERNEREFVAVVALSERQLG